MQSYDPPPETDGLTPEQAQRALNRMHADFQSDRDHPFGNSGHAQHRDFADYSTKLHTILATAKAEAEDTAATQELAAALAETQGFSPAECLARATKLTLTPGYVNRTMAPEERADLAKEIAALYLAGCHEPEPSTPEETETDDDV